MSDGLLLYFVDAGYGRTYPREGDSMQKLEAYLVQIRKWEYCYCKNCDKIRYSSELEATERGIRCYKCGGYNLEAPRWVLCPAERGSAVKCPRAGKGIIRGDYAVECKYRCIYRRPES